ncbi:hypothetical protein Tco_0487423 [Tanacetum coccineum]
MGENRHEEGRKWDTVVGIIEESGVHSNFTSWSFMHGSIRAWQLRMNFLGNKIFGTKGSRTREAVQLENLEIYQQWWKNERDEKRNSQRQGTSPSGTRKRSFIPRSYLSRSTAKGAPIHPEADEQDFTSTNWRHPQPRKMAYASVVYNVSTDPRWSGKRLVQPDAEWLHRQLADLREEFIERFALRRRCFKDPTEISAFMSNSKCLELARRFSDQVPKTVTEMMKRVDDFINSKEVYRSTKLPRGEFHEKGQGAQSHGNRPSLDALTKKPKEILATELQLQLPPCPLMVGTPKKENLDQYCDYQGEKGHYTNDCYQLKRQLKRALESGKLSHLVKDVKQRRNAKER